MAHISVKNLTVEFKVYGSNSRSIKKKILSQATGGRIAQGENDTISVKALDNVSLEIKEGDRIGLVGHNGAGKSTFLRTLSGIYQPVSGSIEIAGKVSALFSPSAGMDKEATGIENIYLRGFVLGLTRAEIDQKIDEIANFTELGDFLHLPVRTYSAGMYSRLGFAISTSISPDILLIDEGIGTGDAKFMKKMQERLDDAYASTKILLLASHNKSMLNEKCSKLIFFNKGRIEKLVSVK